jgi:hypothetical protein
MFVRGLRRSGMYSACCEKRGGVASQIVSVERSLSAITSNVELGVLVVSDLVFSVLIEGRFQVSFISNLIETDP